MISIEPPPRQLLTIANQLWELERRIPASLNEDGTKRHFERMREALLEMHLAYESPIGESFDETRTDVEAHIAGKSTEDLEIIRVLKPIVRYVDAGATQVIQKGVVVVSAKGLVNSEHND